MVRYTDLEERDFLVIDEEPNVAEVLLQSRTGAKFILRETREERVNSLDVSRALPRSSPRCPDLTCNDKILSVGKVGNFSGVGSLPASNIGGYTPRFLAGQQGSLE